MSASATTVLALDTATEVSVVALGRLADDRVTVIDTQELSAPRAAMSKILTCSKSLLDRNGFLVEEMQAIVVGRGPGSFTGVRIGVSTAKGLAHGLGVPLLGIGTLDAIAWRFSRTETLVGVVGDAMRGEVYPALFRCGHGAVERLSEDKVSAPDAAAQAWREHRGGIVLAGNGLAKHGAVFSAVLGNDAIAEPDHWHPTGVGLLQAAAQATVATASDPGAVLPIYTRLSDAEENERSAEVPSGDLPASGVAGDGS